MPIFAAAVFTSAFLLFWVQPLYSKMVLPLLGGAPAVWNTAMMFFQLVLLAGYGYAHLLTTKVPRLRWQIAIHGVVVLGALLFLPLAVPTDAVPPTAGTPIFWLVGLLAVTLGWPFFALSASAPLLQAWFGRSGHARANDPYFLYAASNCGSLLALLAFPLLLEPELTLAGQSHAWLYLYIAMLLILALAAAMLWRADKPVAVSEPVAPAMHIPWRERMIWIALAFVPSSLLLGVTTYITTDIASAPLFWVLPLALYLLSFIIAFARQSWLDREVLLKAQGIGILAVSILLVLVLAFQRGGSVMLIVSVHLLTLLLTAIVCHAELARRRPDVGGLTTFYFCMSVGGALGGIFNALIAPLIFSSDYEYYLILIAACLLRGPAGRFTIRDAVLPLLLGVAAALVAWMAVDSKLLNLGGRMMLLLPCALVLYSFAASPYRFALGVGAVLAGVYLVAGSTNVIHTERSFFGISKVTKVEGGARVALIHGTTMHGTEFVDPKRWGKPIAYYALTGPIGQAMTRMKPHPDVAAIGLGTGALACYRNPGERWTFFEIDSTMERIARTYFHYLSRCGEGVKMVFGDGRLSLKAAPDRSYDLLFIDAFSSDSVPAHLLTGEAMRLYLNKLKPGGVILINISNEYLYLAPVVGNVAGSVGAVARHQLYYPTTDLKPQGASASEWVAIAATDADLAFLNPEPRWKKLAAEPGVRPWSDDFSNIFRAIRW